MPIATAIAGFLFFTLPTGTAAIRSITPFDLLDDGSVVVPVTIGGTGPYRFVLDTGSSRTVISTRLLQTLRLPVVAKTQMVTPTGSDLAYIVRLDRLAVDNRPDVKVSAAVMPADRYAAGHQVDGLIGQDVLANAIYTIDYARRTISWHGPGEVLLGEQLPLQIRDNRLLVSLAQHHGDPRPLRLVPDSGSDAIVLFAHAQHKLRLTQLEVGVLTSLSGARLARRVEVAALVIGSAVLKNPMAVVIDNGELAEMMGDGLLPLHLFARVTFNVAEGYLIIHAPPP